MTAAREGGPADWKGTMKRCSMRNVIAILPGVVLLPVLAAAQAPERTPWGDPDLQGVWTNTTTTPLERPSEFEERAVLSEEERAEFDAQAEAARDRPPPPGQTGSYNSFWFDRGLRSNRTSLIVDPPRRAVPADDGACAGERPGVRGHAGRHAVRHVVRPESLRPLHHARDAGRHDPPASTTTTTRSCRRPTTS